jgi:hypothetical protein
MEFVQPFPNDVLQRRPTTPEQHDKYFALVTDVAITADIAAFLEAVDQTNNTMVLQIEAFRQSTDRRIALMGKRTKSEEELILLWFQLGGRRGLIATLKELADAIAHFRQGGVV